MSLSILGLWLVLALLSAVVARRAELVDWLGRQTLLWRMLARIERRLGERVRVGR